MNSPPCRFWPGALMPLQVFFAAPAAVWRCSSSDIGRRVSASGGHCIFHPNLLPGPLAAKFVLGCASLAQSVLLPRVSFADEPEYRYEHSPPVPVVSLTSGLRPVHSLPESRQSIDRPSRSEQRLSKEVAPPRSGSGLPEALNGSAARGR